MSIIYINYEINPWFEFNHTLKLHVSFLKSVLCEDWTQLYSFFLSPYYHWLDNDFFIFSNLFFSLFLFRLLFCIFLLLFNFFNFYLTFNGFNFIAHKQLWTLWMQDKQCCHMFFIVCIQSFVFIFIFLLTTLSHIVGR